MLAEKQTNKKLLSSLNSVYIIFFTFFFLNFYFTSFFSVLNSFMVPSAHRKQKSRMEEINEIIARSQTRAQAMMASGAYLDGTFKHLNPSRDFNLSAATNASGEVSPDTSLALSDTSFASGGMFNNSFLNLSGAFPPGTPRK